MRDSLSGGAQSISDNLYLLLARKCRGKALSITQLNLDQCGVEVWRALHREYEPEGADPHRAMLAAIVQPKWWEQQGHRERAFTEVLYDWENLIARYTSPLRRRDL